MLFRYGDADERGKKDNAGYHEQAERPAHGAG